jgi:hypothetical protein
VKNIIVEDGRNYRVISGNAISILDHLSPAIYEVDFNMTGFSLNKTEGKFNVVEKLYGEVEVITSRVLKTFDIFDRNLGVLFSGPRGLGKSLTARNICKVAIERGLPVILVTKHFDNITSFLETITQPAVIFFDEFEKFYPNQLKTDCDDIDGQDNLLNLFDSVLSGKKLFLLTCNLVYNLSKCLLNRPGRIHYHFKSVRISIDEIKEYCKDNLPSEMNYIVSDICSLGALIPDFSYDMLKSIVFELKTYNCDLKEVKKYLNIDARTRSLFDFTVYYESGRIEREDCFIDISDTRAEIRWYKELGHGTEFAIVNVSKAKWTGDPDGSIVVGKEYIQYAPMSSDGNVKNTGGGDRVEKIVFVPSKYTVYDPNDY